LNTVFFFQVFRILVTPSNVGHISGIDCLKLTKPLNLSFFKEIMFSVGLVGLPNAGKSTLFNLVTKMSVPAENFPFCTIEPTSGIVYVPDERVEVLATMSNSQKKVLATIEFRDIAGLVKNAHQGAGLGNQFLSHIREVDLILLVIRTFENEQIVHVENRVSPQEDEEILLLELMLADQNTLEKMLPKLQREARSGDQLSLDKLSLVEELLNRLTNLQLARSLVLDPTLDKELIKWRKSLNLLTDKPILRLANVNYGGKNHDYSADVYMDVKLELELQDASMEERQALDLPVDKPMDLLIRKCYQTLNLGTFLTTGRTETRAWTFPLGWLAPRCAGIIHSDFEKTFINAEVISYHDLLVAGGWKEAAEAGKLRIEGKNYLMQDGDVVEFRVGAQAK